MREIKKTSVKGRSKKNMGLRINLGVNSSYNHRQGSFRKTSRRQRVFVKKEMRKSTEFKTPAGVYIE